MPEDPAPPSPPPGKPRRQTGTGFAGETTGGQGTEPSDSGTLPRGRSEESTRGQDSAGEQPTGSQPSQPSQSSQSHQIIDDFEILSKLGQGGMGWVYRARQMTLDRQVALKILPSHLDQDPLFVARFVREARVAGNLHHPNLVKVFTSGVADGTHFIAMELVEGETLAQWVKRGALPPLEALRITLDVARALEYGWRTAQLIHRDVKPSNIFLSQDGRVKLGDLGLAKTLDGETSTGLTQTGKAMGTPHYISPEQARGDREIDFRTDIYSLGCTLFHILTGQTPYTGSDAVAVFHHHIHSPPPAILKVMPGLPLPLARLVARMLKKHRRERFSSYEELIAAIESVQVQLDPSLVAAIKTAASAQAEVGTHLRGVQETDVAGAGQGRLGEPSLPAQKKSKLPLYAGLAAGVLVFGIVGYLIWPKEEPLTAAQRYARDHADESKARVNAAVLVASLNDATKDAPFINTLGMKFVPVPIVGGPTQQQRVLFGIWDTRVQDYEAFVKETNREWPKPDFEQGPTHPAVAVTREDAQAFCGWLTERESKAGKLPEQWRYRLPSDHEWSCAVGIGAREDSTQWPSEKSDKLYDIFPWGSQWPPPANAGNYAGEELQPLLAEGKFAYVKGVIAGYRDGFVNTSPAGSFPGNLFGLFDMGGNVAQWCEDWFDQDQKERVLRGASWSNERRSSLQSSNRNHRPSTFHSYNYGFRCVLAPNVSAEGRAPARP